MDMNITVNNINLPLFEIDFVVSPWGPLDNKILNFKIFFSSFFLKKSFSNLKIVIWILTALSGY